MTKGIVNKGVLVCEKIIFRKSEIIDILNHQVIHMDQGLTHTPEYLTTRKMSNYPSRTAQIIRSVYLGELDASEYGAEMVFSPILSGQGERWQNFGEARRLSVKRNASKRIIL